ncbi:MAG: ATP-binding protein [Kofleriaceae bacterium]|nr:ATP-binding protein [Kofleriaceae bacterium]
MFVGRDREQAQLERGLARVPVAVVCGLAGVGKSSLAYAVAAAWAGPVVHARATAAGPSALLDELRRALGAVTELRTDDERATALARALDAAGALAVVDDLHVLRDAEQAWLLGELGAHLARGRLLATSRVRPASAQGYDRVEIHLGGLPARAARELWVALDELRGPTAGFQRAFDATGGNPFLLRRRHAGDPGGPDPLAAAVAQLAPDRARLLGAIAVAKVPLGGEALAAVHGGEPRAALTDLRRALLVDLDGEGRPLLHELVRDAALATLPPATRAELAAALAHALSGERTVAAITAVAQHWLDAGLPRDARDHLVARASDLLNQGASRELAAIALALPPTLRDAEVAALHARALVRLVDVEAGERALRDALAARPPSGAVLLPLATPGAAGRPLHRRPRRAGPRRRRRGAAAAGQRPTSPPSTPRSASTPRPPPPPSTSSPPPPPAPRARAARCCGRPRPTSPGSIATPSAASAAAPPPATTARRPPTATAPPRWAPWPSAPTTSRPRPPTAPAPCR